MIFLFLENPLSYDGMMMINWVSTPYFFEDFPLYSLFFTQQEDFILEFFKEIWAFNSKLIEFILMLIEK